MEDLLVVELEGFDALEREMAERTNTLRRKFSDASYDAAAAGIERAQFDHPYQNRTRVLSFTAHPEREVSGADLIAVMAWPAEYASYVDKGTVRSRPYPFTPVAEYAAESVLNQQIAYLVDEFCRAIEAISEG